MQYLDSGGVSWSLPLPYTGACWGILHTMGRLTHGQSSQDFSVIQGGGAGIDVGPSFCIVIHNFWRMRPGDELGCVCARLC